MVTKHRDDERDLSREEVISRIRKGLLAARDDVVGIIVFGTFARGEAWKDLDVVVVLRSLERGNRAWVDTAIALGRAIDLYAVDIIPFSEMGFLSGLKNHGPFLLDVATDGLLLYDRANLAEEMAETRRYIQARGIRRTRPGGWKYPVLYRKSTALSERRNEDYVRQWLADAKRDREAAEVLRQSGLHDRSVFHCQQAIERAVKAVLACFGTFARIHFVAKDLWEAIKEEPKIAEWRDRLERLAEIALEMEKHVSRTRYIMTDEDDEVISTPEKSYSEPDSMQALDVMHEALRIAEEFVIWWFASDEEQS